MFLKEKYKDNTISILNNLISCKLAEVFRYKTFSSKEIYKSHSHNRIEINFIRKGDCKMEIEGQQIAFKNGEIAFIFPDAQHDFQAGNNGCTIMQLEFPSKIFTSYSELLDTLTKMEPQQENHGYIKIINNEEIKEIVQEIIHELSSGYKYTKISVLMYYGLLIIHLLRYTQSLLDRQ